jgi:D-aminoacyl-tRNA deacylase
MRAVLQRVLRAKVTVDDEIVGEIGRGLVVLLGISSSDSEDTAKTMVGKILNLRIFDDREGKMDVSLLDCRGDLLVVSQFTLYGDARKGRRPSYIQAASPESAKIIYSLFVNDARKEVTNVATGKFQAMMQVELINDGPVTILLDSDKNF